MGRFLNPDNSSFQDVINSEIYVDKTGLLDYTNSVINTTSKFICNSRPRRFGKSMTADMLSAYYSRGCDSKELFKNYEIRQKYMSINWTNGKFCGKLCLIKILGGFLWIKS